MVSKDILGYTSQCLMSLFISFFLFHVLSPYSKLVNTLRVCVGLCVCTCVCV